MTNEHAATTMFKTCAVIYQNNINSEQINVASFLHENTYFAKNLL